MRICAEVVVEIHHNLLANCPPEDIKVIASKPEVFAQCRNWISTSFNEVQLVPVASSSKAGGNGRQRGGPCRHRLDPGGRTLRPEDRLRQHRGQPLNQTRFFVISTTPAKRTGSDKTAIMFTTAHKAGALVEVLNVFSRHGINLTNIDTAPVHAAELGILLLRGRRRTLRGPRFRRGPGRGQRHCGELHVLGSFPRAVQV